MQSLKHNCTFFRDLVDAWGGHYQSLSLELQYLYQDKVTSGELYLSYS